jgi:hypothetical protein
VFLGLQFFFFICMMSIRALELRPHNLLDENLGLSLWNERLRYENVVSTLCKVVLGELI